MSDLDLKFLCDETVKIAREAGEIVMEYYHNGAKEMIKSDGSDVTEADLASDAFITAALQKLTPGIPVVTEEGIEAGRVPDVSGGRYWSVDPIDGTIPFIKREDGFSILISLLVNFEPVIGVAYYPAKKKYFSAVKNYGVFFTDDKTGEKVLHKTYPVTREYPKITCNPNYNEEDKFFGMFAHIPKENLLFSSEYHMYELLTGGIDMIAFTRGGGGEWDLAAFKLILEEAGGGLSAPFKFGNIKQKVTPMCILRHIDSMRFIRP